MALDNFGIKFANKCLKKFYELAVTPKITNDWYEGQIKTGRADRLKIKTVTESQGIQTYTPGTALTLGTLSDVEASLIPDQRKAYYFEIDSVDNFENYCDDVVANVLDQKVNELYETIDAYVLGLYGDVAAGNRIGGTTTKGTITVTVTTGAITQSTQMFTTPTIGRGIQLGGTVWFRVKDFASTGALTATIENDEDDVTSHYTGGAFETDTDFVTDPITPVEVTKTNIYAKIVAMKVKLDAAKAPKTDRWLVVNSSVGGLLLQASELIPAVAVAYEGVVKNGYIGRIAGFDVYQSEQISGEDNSTTGLRILAGHISWMTFAHAFVESKIEEDLPGEFGKAYKGLNCYGGKVIDERRKMGVELWCYTG